MLKNYFKIALRNLLRHKVYSLINILGLSVGMAACIAIMLFVNYELSFDNIHKKNIYRLDEVQKFEGMVAPQNVALSMYPMAPTLNADFPEILNATRIFPSHKFQIQYQDKKIFLEKAFMADSAFMEVFDFELLKGNRTTALDEPNSIILTEKSAKNIFGKENPIGKTLLHQGGDTLQLKVVGVLKDVPKTSHLQFDALISIYTVEKPEWMQNWGSNWLNTYLELSPQTDIAKLEKKFPAFLKKYMKDEGWKSYELFLQPLKQVHAASVDITHDYNNHQKFDGTYTYIFLVLALLVLSIAGINFMNLSTAKSAMRAKEVGVRKSIGARRSQLAGQFIGESLLFAFISVALAVTLVKLFLPYINELSQRELEFPLFKDPALLLTILGGTIVIGVLSGFYPALILSAFKPVKVLKGDTKAGGKGILRNILVVGQFAAAIFLIIATTFAVRQLRYMQDRDTGFDREQVMIIPLDRTANEKYDVLKEELLKHPEIKAVTASQQRLGNNLHQTGIKFQGDGALKQIATSQVIVDKDYLSFYKIDLVAGRNFSSDYRADNGKAFIVNESMAKELLKDNPKASVQSLIGKPFGFGWMDTLGTLVGVAKDFNFNSLHHKIETLTIHNQKNWGFNELSVKIDGSKAKKAISEIEAVWIKALKDRPFEYSFLDEHFEQLYKADRQVSEVVGILAGLAIVISCLGLYGLASFTAEKRTKEIGIRKVLGANIQSIITLLSKDFLKLVLIANIISWPIAWWVLSNWLQDFAYRIEINPYVFIMAGVIALLIAFLTVSYQSIKAARVDPVKSLRSE